MSDDGDVVLARLVGREAGLIVASLNRRLGDFDIAEEAVQEAVVIALGTWRRDGVPPNPAAWLTLTAQRRAIDLLRRRSREKRVVWGGLDQLDVETSTGGPRHPPRPTSPTNGCRCCSAAVTRRCVSTCGSP